MSFFTKFLNKKTKNSKSKPIEKNETVLMSKFDLNNVYNSFEDYHPIKTDLISDEFTRKQYEEVFSDEIINLKTLKKLAWNGIPTSII